MKSVGLLSVLAGALMLGLAGAANAAPVGTALPALKMLSISEGSVEQVQYWRYHHRRCHWVRYHGHWHRRCHH